jgi:hypothetical protein
LQVLFSRTGTGTGTGSKKLKFLTGKSVKTNFLALGD